MKRQLYSLIIVEDEESISAGLKNYVDWNTLGFKVDGTFEDGKEAIEYIKSGGVDAILSDIKMAEVSGLELAEFVQNSFPQVPMVLMSGYRDFEYARKAILLKVRDYMLKPVKFDQLKQVFGKLHEEITDARTIETFADLPSKSNKEKPKNEEELGDYITNFLENTPDNGDVRSPGDYKKAIIAKAKEYIRNNLSRDISLEEVSNHVHLSPVYFSRFFKENTGENLITLITRYRMEKSIKLLITRKYKIQEISELIGYQSSKYFTRVFKNNFGLTPTEYLHTEI